MKIEHSITHATITFRVCNLLLLVPALTGLQAETAERGGTQEPAEALTQERLAEQEKTSEGTDPQKEATEVPKAQPTVEAPVRAPSTISGEKIELGDALTLDSVSASELMRELALIYPRPCALDSCMVEVGYKKGVVVQGAMVSETDTDIILDKNPCKQELAVLHRPYQKKELRTVTCGERKLKVVSVVQK
jgi:hypothetical protein